MPINLTGEKSTEIWKNAFENWKGKNNKDGKFFEDVKENNETVEKFKWTYENSYKEVYSNWFTEKNDTTLSKIRENCSLTVEKALTVFDLSKNEDVEIERIVESKKSTDNSIDKEKIKTFCKEFPSKNYLGEENKDWKLGKTYCLK